MRFLCDTSEPYPQSTTIHIHVLSRGRNHSTGRPSDILRSAFGVRKLSIKLMGPSKKFDNVG